VRRGFACGSEQFFSSSARYAQKSNVLHCGFSARLRASRSIAAMRTDAHFYLI